jgi:hypothetical protein
MSRELRVYGERGAHRRFEGLDVSTPTEGYYRYRLRSGAVYGGVRIWHGPPLDPVTGEELDRGWRWQATFNGEYIDLDRVWPACGRMPIDKAEHDRLARQSSWARDAAPGSAFANSTRKIDRLSLDEPLPF